MGTQARIPAVPSLQEDFFRKTYIIPWIINKYVGYPEARQLYAFSFIHSSSLPDLRLFLLFCKRLEFTGFLQKLNLLSVLPF